MCMDAWIASIWFTQSTCPPYMRIITVTTAGSAHIIGNTRLFKPWGGGCVRYIKLQDSVLSITTRQRQASKKLLGRHCNLKHNPQGPTSDLHRRWTYTCSPLTVVRKHLPRPANSKIAPSIHQTFKIHNKYKLRKRQSNLNSG